MALFTTIIEHYPLKKHLLPLLLALSADDTLYDLQGRPVTNPAPGLYIRSGALTVIK